MVKNTNITMRLWHYKLIKKLPRQQLLGQHRECCALRGKGWGKKHSIVNYVFNYPYIVLYWYHYKIMQEMTRRGYNVNKLWWSNTYRGKIVGEDFSSFTSEKHLIGNYPEHNNNYLKECLDNLKGKGVIIEV